MGKGHCLTLAVVFCLVQVCYTDDTSDSSRPVVTQTWVDKLKKDLLANYDRNLRPTQHFNVTSVDLKMTIRHVDIDEETSIFSVYGWVKMSWLDLRMTWSPADYGGLDSILISSYYLWDAELYIHSSALESSGTTYYSATKVRIDNRGNHSCTVRVHLKTFCEMNLRRWPFDTQHCPIVLGKSVVNQEDTIQLNVLPGEMVQTNRINPSWKIVDLVTETYENPMEEDHSKFVGVQYGIVTRRMVKIFHSTVIVPAIVLILLTLANFWLPPGAGEKILLNCINAAIVCSFLIYFTMHLPLLATRTPLVVLFFSNSLYLIAFGLIVSVVTYNMVRFTHTNPVHPYVKAFLALPGVQLVVWSGSDTKPVTEEEDWNEELKTEVGPSESCSSANDSTTMVNSSYQKDWTRFALALERFCFIIYVFLFSVMAACYLN
ncbi:neuronal acetylcholine receptor subunit beta-4-like isoform X1 [Wyeomyia smithii]|uniref:neuronal acetylcholine receptor subunit beta-4-like isoform X1 n=1 Tax=Wyeomyia smithii TaxID=174621 RepID=UPI002467AC6B|nr:neuronal acetylcholine receptor subunit beta-4-like isoform X1 [Wyeomyia smithii]